MSEDKKDPLNEGITPMTDIEGTPVAFVPTLPPSDETPVATVATVPTTEEERNTDAVDEIINLQVFLLEEAFPGVLEKLEQRYPPDESVEILCSALMVAVLALGKGRGSTNEEMAVGLEALASELRQHGDTYGV